MKGKVKRSRGRLRSCRALRHGLGRSSRALLCLAAALGAGGLALAPRQAVAAPGASSPTPGPRPAPTISTAAPGARIVGGAPAPAGSFPWMALVLENLPGGDQQLLCSGTVVAAQLVLTAGHCAVDLASMAAQPAGRYSVSTGSLDPNEDPATQVSAVSRVIPYPGLVKLTSAAGSTYLQGDAALLELSSPTSAPAIRIADPAADESLYQASTPAAIAGWGLTGASGQLPNRLRWAPTVVQAPTLCGQVAADDFGAAFDAATQTCAIEAPAELTGACGGDSGGPLIALAGDGTLVQIGITSWAQSQCSAGYPDYFTRTDALWGWIRGWISALGPPAARPAGGARANPQVPLGSYRGSTSQHLPLRMVITRRGADAAAAAGGGGRTLAALAVAFTARCTRRRTPLRRWIRVGGWRLTARPRAGLGLSRSFRARDGARYRLSVRLTPAGGAFGSLSASWKSPADGSCLSGPIRWIARRG